MPFQRGFCAQSVNQLVGKNQTGHHQNNFAQGDANAYSNDIDFGSP
jgi:hypothetical protein